MSKNYKKANKENPKKLPQKNCEEYTLQTRSNRDILKQISQNRVSRASDITFKLEERSKKSECRTLDYSISAKDFRNLNMLGEGLKYDSYQADGLMSRAMDGVQLSLSNQFKEEMMKLNKKENSDSMSIKY